MRALCQTAARAAAVSSQQGINKPYSLCLVLDLSVNKAVNGLGADWKVEVMSLIDHRAQDDHPLSEPHLEHGVCRREGEAVCSHGWASSRVASCHCILCKSHAAKSIPLPHEGLSRGANGSAKRCPAADSLAACPRRNSSSCDWGGGQGRPWGAVCGLQGELGDTGL